MTEPFFSITHPTDGLELVEPILISAKLKPKAPPAKAVRPNIIFEIRFSL